MTFKPDQNALAARERLCFGMTPPSSADAYLLLRYCGPVLAELTNVDPGAVACSVGP